MNFMQSIHKLTTKKHTPPSPFPGTFTSFIPTVYHSTGKTTNDYNVFVFTSNSTITYTALHGTTLNILAVGGGGGGGMDNSGGGGGGGVAFKTISIPSGSGSISVVIGAGGGPTSPGATTSFRFQTGSATDVIAGGGGQGSNYNKAGFSGSVDGGSGAGSPISGQVLLPAGKAVNANQNYANDGGTGSLGHLSNGGGGGAGTVGASANGAGLIGHGGDGIRCTLDGIKDFGDFGVFYWGGGGGGAGYSTLGGNGGAGGGGAGSWDVRDGINKGPGISDTLGINPATAPTRTFGGNGGANTGGGAGGAGTVQAGGTGGSGIVVVAFFIIIHLHGAKKTKRFFADTLLIESLTNLFCLQTFLLSC